MAGFPGRNPFPALAVAGAEEILLPGAQRIWARHTPTVITREVDQARRQLEHYLNTPDGGGLGWLCGGHGAGKTHTALHLLAHARDVAPGAVQVYLPLQERDFTAAYRPLVTQVSPDLFTDLSLRQLGAIAADVAGELGGPEYRQKVLDAVDARPSAVFDYFDRHEIEAGRVQEEQAREIAACTGGDWPRFQRALRHLHHPELFEDAYEWLCGRRLDDGVRRALGVGEPILDPVTCRRGVQLLATLARRSGKPFILVLDQAEKFLLDGDRPVPANAGLLQRLTDHMSGASGLLFLVSHEAAWDRLPPDVQQRFGGVCRMSRLTPDDAERVLSAYAGPAGDDEIRPFTEDGLHELLRRSGGNMRRLLRLGRTSFDDAMSLGAVDLDAVVTATDGHGGFPGVTELAAFAEKRLRAKGLSVERVEQPGGAISLLLPGRHSPRAVLIVSDAVFRDAEGVVRAIAMPAQNGRVAFTGLLVRGYGNPDVLGALPSVVDLSLVADGSPEFETRLDRLVEKLEPLGPEESRPVTAAEPFDGPSPPQPTPWQVRRDELTRRISEAREARETADMVEFREAWTEEARRRGTRFLIRTVLTVAVLAVAAAFTPPGLAWKLLLALAAGGTAAYVIGTRLTGAGPTNAPPETRRQLDRFARELGAERERKSGHPLSRYVRALEADPEKDFPYLKDRLLEEPLAVVRQAIGKRMALTEQPFADCVDLIPQDWQRVPEVLLLLARSRPSHEFNQSPQPLHRLPPELRVLVALANRHILEPAAGVRAGNPAERALEALGKGHPLAQTYNGGWKMGQLTLSPSELRATARMLSPLEPDGLGSYDWLPVVGDIDDLYLFFEELLFRQEENSLNRLES